MIPDFAIYALGFSAQILFSARTFYQWLASEKAKTVLAPRFFWQISLFASTLLFLYGYLRHDFAIMFGQVLTYFVYIRNIQINRQWEKFPVASRWFFLSFPLVVMVLSFSDDSFDFGSLFHSENIPTGLLALGIFAQMLFTFRFVYQWMYAEKNKISSLPKGFWLISLMGSALILLYGILRKDPVLIVGHSFGAVVYVRNLKLLKT